MLLLLRWTLLQLNVAYGKEKHRSLLLPLLLQLLALLQPQPHLGVVPLLVRVLESRLLLLLLKGKSHLPVWLPAQHLLLLPLLSPLRQQKQPQPQMCPRRQQVHCALRATLWAGQQLLQLPKLPSVVRLCHPSQQQQQGGCWARGSASQERW